MSNGYSEVANNFEHQLQSSYLKYENFAGRSTEIDEVAGRQITTEILYIFLFFSQISTSSVKGENDFPKIQQTNNVIQT
ncbi:hypothetical protein SNEBB_000608 [Seison nebaliae]|nr:hypothetical protein SNEBB_000608 [Seison nebaliae]